MLITFTVAPMSSGVRVSPAARSADPMTNRTVAAGTAITTIRRKRAPSAATSGVTPKIGTILGAHAATGRTSNTASTAPTRADCSTVSSACPTSPAPTNRATSASVPVPTAIVTTLSAPSTCVPTPTAATADAPSRPTIRVSTNPTSDSSASVTITGHASCQMMRTSRFRSGSTAPYLRRHRTTQIRLTVASRSRYRSAAMDDLVLVSADSHVNEPPEMFGERLPAALRGRAPHVESIDGVDCLVMEGMRPRKLPRGLEMLDGAARERAQAGGWDPRQRLRDQDRDGVSAEVVFPTLALQACFMSPDPALQYALAAAYNDWVAEVFVPFGERFAAAAVIPMLDIARAQREAERAAGLGLRSLFLPCRVSDRPYNDPSYDPFWAVAAEIRLPLTFHAGTGHEPRIERGPGARSSTTSWGRRPMARTWSATSRCRACWSASPACR